jgi:integrase
MGSFVDPKTGKRVHVSHRDRSVARQRLEDARRGAKPRRSGERLHAYLARWLDVLDVQPRTLEGYTQIVRDSIVPALGDIRLDALRAPDVIAWVKAEQTRYSPTTVAHHLACLRAALNQAVAWELIPASPARSPLVKGPSVKRREYRILTDDEARAFLRHVEGDPLEALWIMAVHLGMRSGELRGLRWQDVDLDAGTLTVNQVVTRHGFGPPKTPQSRRLLPLPARAGVLLAERRAKVRVLRLDGLIFADVHQRPITDAWLVRRFQLRLREAGLPRVRLHDLRHAAATRLIQSGANLAYVQRILGHSTITTTIGIYGHIEEREVRDALERAAL